MHLPPTHTKMNFKSKDSWSVALHVTHAISKLHSARTTYTSLYYIQQGKGGLGENACRHIHRWKREFKKKRVHTQETQCNTYVEVGLYQPILVAQNITFPNLIWLGLCDGGKINFLSSPSRRHIFFDNSRKGIIAGIAHLLRKSAQKDG